MMMEKGTMASVSPPATASSPALPELLLHDSHRWMSPVMMYVSGRDLCPKCQRAASCAALFACDLVRMTAGMA